MTLQSTLTPATPRARLDDLIAREKKRTRHRHLVLWALLVAVVALGIGAWSLLRPRPIPLAMRFRELPITAGDVVREVRATGRLEAVTTVQVGAEISGRIATVEVNHNDRVEEGRILARFDRAALSAQLAQTEANLLAARAALEQAKTDRNLATVERARAAHLHRSGSISDAEYDSRTAADRLAEQRVVAAEAQLASQQAQFRVARTNLEHTIIRSPIAGVVITRNVDPGQTVASVLQTPVLFTVTADLRKMRVLAAIDEADIGEVHLGQAAVFTVNGYPDRLFEGKVTEVRNSPAVVQDVVTYGTVIEVDNLDLALKPGMTASARVTTKSVKNVLRVPAAALRFTPPGEKAGGHPGVWLLDGEALRRNDVKTGISDGELTEVTSDWLSVNQKVVVELTHEGRKAYGLTR